MAEFLRVYGMCKSGGLVARCERQTPEARSVVLSPHMRNVRIPCFCCLPGPVFAQFCGTCVTFVVIWLFGSIINWWESTVWRNLLLHLRGWVVTRPRRSSGVVQPVTAHWSVFKWGDAEETVDKPSPATDFLAAFLNSWHRSLSGLASQVQPHLVMFGGPTLSSVSSFRTAPPQQVAPCRCSSLSSKCICSGSQMVRLLWRFLSDQYACAHIIHCGNRDPFVKVHRSFISFSWALYLCFVHELAGLTEIEANVKRSSRWADSYSCSSLVVAFQIWRHESQIWRCWWGVYIEIYCLMRCRDEQNELKCVGSVPVDMCGWELRFIQMIVLVMLSLT